MPRRVHLLEVEARDYLPVPAAPGADCRIVRFGWHPGSQQVVITEVLNGSVRLSAVSLEGMKTRLQAFIEMLSE